MVRALTSHQCGLGTILAERHMWVEFVVGSRPCSEGFSPGTLGFPSSTNTNISILHFNVGSDGRGFVSKFIVFSLLNTVES